MFNSNFLDLVPNFFLREEFNDSYDEAPTLQNQGLGQDTENNTPRSLG